MGRYHIGVVHERLGDLARAEKEFNRALEESVSEVSSLYHLALIHRSRGETAKAEEVLKRARQFGLKNAAASRP
jgi:Tfp pilus assembly protein PilF